MSKTNIYDFIIAELIYRLDSATSPTFAPRLEIHSDLPFDDLAPFNFNGNITFTSEIKNVPTGYTVKANTHIMTYSNSVITDTGSSTILVGSAISTSFAVIGNTMTVTGTITLEKAANPDIVVPATFVVTAAASIFSGTKATNNSFNTTGLSSSVYSTSNPKVSLNGTTIYPYFAIPAAMTQPIYFRDQNGDIIPITDFTMTNSGSYNYYVLNWKTSFASPSTVLWSIIFTLD